MQLSLREINQHSSDLGSIVIANQSLNVLVDGVSYQSFLLLLVASVVVLREDRHGEHLLDLSLVLLRMLHLDIHGMGALRTSLRHHAGIHHLILHWKW